MEPKLAHFVGPKSPDFAIPDKCYAEIIVDNLAKRPDDKVFIEYPSRRETTAGEISSKSRCLARFLVDKLSVEKGDVACICSYNVGEFLIALYGSTMAGMSAMLCNALYSYYEMHHQIVDSNSKILFIPGDKVFIEKSLKAIEGSNVKRIILITEVDDVKYLEELRTSECSVHISLLKDVCEDDASDEVPKISWDWDSDTAIIPYSSGTTGRAKGVLLRHAAMRHHIKTFSIFDKMMPTESSDKRSTSFLIPPFFHVYGFLIGALSVAFYKGVFVIQRRFNFTQMLECIQNYRIDRLYLLPAVLTQIAKDPIVDSFDLRSVEILFYGAAPMPKDQLKTALANFKKEKPPVVMQGYGMTEASGTALPPGAPEEMLYGGSVGVASMDCEVKIVDLNTLETVPVGVEGEIWLKSYVRMSGYLNRPEETKNTITEEGWVRSGDIGYFKENGYLFITDRLKELIKYKGYQVPPAELEDLLLTHPAVKDATVVGKKDETSGELPTAFVVLDSNEQSVSEADIQQYVKERAAPYKQLKGGVFFVDSIPRNPSGKILRRKMIERIPK